MATELFGFFFLDFGKSLGFMKLAGHSIHSYMCHNRSAQLQVKQWLLALLGFKTSP